MTINILDISPRCAHAVGEERRHGPQRVHDDVARAAAAARAGSRGPAPTPRGERAADVTPSPAARPRCRSCPSGLAAHGHPSFLPAAATANWKTRFAARIVVVGPASVSGLTSFNAKPPTRGASA